MGHNSTTWVGWRVLPMTISHTTHVSWRWSIQVLHGWAEHDHFLCHTGRPEMVHTSTTDGPNMIISHAIQVGQRWSYRYYMGGPKGAPDDHSLCHIGWLEMEHYLHDFSEASQWNWLTDFKHSEYKQLGFSFNRSISWFSSELVSELKQDVSPFTGVPTWFFRGL